MSNLGDNTTVWLADAKAGDLSTMPNPFTWDQSVEFAHIIDGYGFAGGLPQCMEIANNALTSEPDPNDRAGGAMTLWVALFGEHRRWRHFGEPAEGEALRYLDALCEALRGRLQALGPSDCERLRAMMATHPGMAVESDGRA